MKRYLINVLASQDINEITDYYFTTNNIEAGERFSRFFASLPTIGQLS